MHRMTMNQSVSERFSSNKVNKNLKRINLNSRKISKSAQSRPMEIECLNLAKSLGRKFCDPNHHLVNRHWGASSVIKIYLTDQIDAP